MPVLPTLRHALQASVVGALLAPGLAYAQHPGLEVSYGRWWHDTVATTFSAGVYRDLLGPVGYGLGLVHLDDHRAGAEDRTSTGGELTLGVARDGSGFYGVASGALVVVHAGTALDAFWTAGGGVALRIFSGLSVAVEARYRWEDRARRGFWNLADTDRSGWVLKGGVAFGVPGGQAAPRPAGRPAPPPGTPVFEPPPADDINALAREGGASDIAARAATSVVETALSVMGTPYAWGGTDDNGFDCSGLIQYAYREHGIILPRVSRDQLRMGVAVDARVETLRPGDLLGFAVEAGQVSHIGLYVGDGQFIHSASGGVKLSSLTSADPDSRWWQRRWVTARRLID